MTAPADRHARIVIIGGGVIGASVAYHLAEAGECDVLLVEKAQLTHGCTWHAAGLVGQLRGTRNLTRLMQNSVAVFDRLQQKMGMAIEWKKVGSLRLASSRERWSEIRRSMTQAKSFGVECEALSASEAKNLFPYLSIEGVEGAAYIAGDGYVDPYSLTQAYAKVARAAGVTIEEGTTVTGMLCEGRRIGAVITDKGTIACEIVVNCAGLWAKQIGEMVGAPLAAGIVEHQYFLTEKKLDFEDDLTTLRDPDKNFYLKPDTGAFAIGGWEDGSNSCWRGRPPQTFARELFPANMDRLARFAVPASERLPLLNEIGIQTVINGPIPVSADGEPIMGLAPGFENFYVACGFTAGIAASGGAGDAMANWVLHGDPGMDLWAFDVRRFGPLHAQSRYLQARSVEAYAAYYKIHWPGYEAKAARGLRRSPLYQSLKNAGAVYGVKFGWERPKWFAPPGAVAGEEHSFEGKPNWFDAVSAECRGIRERVALIDQSSFAKFEISGPGAHAALERIAVNRIPPEPGRAVYTQLCNAKGGIEADVTICHIDAGRFLVTTGAGFAVRDRHWIAIQLPDDGTVALNDVTNQWSTINLCGPNARALLQSLTVADISNGAFPFLAARKIELGFADVLAIRIGYVGELGFELYVPQEFALHVFELLADAGGDHGLINAGYHAIESCRLEKGYLYWSSDIGPDINPYEAGLGFCVALDRGEFTGKNALERIRGETPSRCLASFSTADYLPLYGGEPIYHRGEIVGSVTSAGYGHRLERTIALGYLPIDLVEETRFDIEAFGNTHAVTKGDRCLYDPHSRRLKG